VSTVLATLGICLAGFLVGFLPIAIPSVLRDRRHRRECVRRFDALVQEFEARRRAVEAERGRRPGFGEGR
jgi:hypothetical protein